MTRRRVEMSIESTAAIDDVWTLLADATTWPSWSSFDDASYLRTGEPPPHGVGAARAFRIGRSRSVDTVLRFEPPTNLAYDYRGPLPIKDYRADVELTPLAVGGTRITWSCEFAPKIPLTGRLMEAVLRKVLGDLSHQLARGAEATTSRPAARNDR